MPQRQTQAVQTTTIGQRPASLAMALVVLFGLSLTWFGVAVQVGHAVLRGLAPPGGAAAGESMTALLHSAAIVGSGLAIALAGWVIAAVLALHLPRYLRPRKTINMVMICLTVFGFAAVACQIR